MVNVNPGYKTQELEFTLGQSGARALFLARRFRNSDFVAILREAIAKCPALKVALVLEEDWARFLQSGRRISRNALEDRKALLAPVDPINIQYTSGTTGMPKGATLTHRNILNNGHFVGQRLGYCETDRVCIPVPFYHCFGMVMGNLACIFHGACMVIPSEGFEALAVLETVQEEACTSLYGVPTMFFGILAHPRFTEYRLSSLRTGIMAGAPCPPGVAHAIAATHVDAGVCDMLRNDRNLPGLNPNFA